MKWIIALDQGTTSCRAMLFDKKGQPVATAQKEFKQFFPQPGWVEHDAAEIWQTQLAVLREVAEKVPSDEIAAIGITNQRETVVVWDRTTGKPLHHAIVWQCRRTSELCTGIKGTALEATIQEKTGLVVDPYFSATKLHWLLEHVLGLRDKAERGEALFGTIDSWLIWNLTGGKVHITDYSNASRTMLFHIHELKWDQELLDYWKIPAAMLPEVRDSSEVYGETILLGDGKAGIPIAGAAGDQQAALFGQACYEPGMAKNTYGTGSFILANTGTKAISTRRGLLTTIAWRLRGQVEYALEGSVFTAGAVVQWLRDGLGIIEHASDIEALAKQVEDTKGVYFVPAFTGMGAPHWKPEARGLIHGLTRGTTKAHIARAALEAIAYQSFDVLQLMEEESGIQLKELRVDGGAAQNDFLMQFQANLIGCSVVRSKIHETTALGAAYLAGLAVGFWKGVEELKGFWAKDETYQPLVKPSERQSGIEAWRRAVNMQ